MTCCLDSDTSLTHTPLIFPCRLRGEGKILGRSASGFNRSESTTTLARLICCRDRLRFVLGMMRACRGEQRLCPHDLFLSFFFSAPLPAHPPAAARTAARSMNKIEIKSYLRDVYGVKVEAVSTQIVLGE